jgi:autotransporter-associated beta strand protein
VYTALLTFSGLCSYKPHWQNEYWVGSSFFLHVETLFFWRFIMPSSRPSQMSAKPLSRRAVARKASGTFLLAAAVAVAGYCTHTIRAADTATSWTGTSTTDSFWNDSANWSAGIPNNGTPTGAVYDATIATTTALPANLDGGTFTVGQLTVTATGTVITNTSATAASLTIDPASMATATASNIAGNIDGVTTGGGITLTFGSGATAAVNSTISGNLLNSISLVLNEPSGTLTLSGTNDYTGGTTLTAGTLAVSADSQLGTGRLTFTGGTLQTTAAISDSRAVALNSGGGTIDTDGQSDLFSGVFSGTGALTVLSSTAGGVLTLSGTNTYTGATTITSGTLALTGTGSIATSSGVTISSGGTLDISQTTSGATIAGLTGTAGTVSLGARTLTLDVASGNDSFGGIIQDGGLGSGTGGVVDKIGAGTEVLSGANTYTGGTTISAGTLVAGASNALASSPVTLTGTTSSATTLESSTYNDAFTTGITSATPETMNVQGYSQDANSTLNLVAFSSASAPITVDSLAVAGTAVASLNGTANILVVNSGNLLNYGQLHDFDTLHIVTTGATPTGVTAAGGLSPSASGATSLETKNVTYGTGFNKITVGELPSASPVDFYETTSSTGVTVTVQTLFGADGKTANEKAVGQYLDNNFSPLNSGITTTAKNTLIALSSATASQVAQVLNEMTPAIYSGLPNAGIQQSTFTSQQVFSEISNSFVNPGFNMSGLSLLQTRQQDPFAQSLESEMNFTGKIADSSVPYMDAMNNSNTPQNHVTSGQWSGFAAGELVLDRLPQTTDAQSAQHLESGGVLTGVDYTLTPHLLIGAMFNWMYTGTTLDSAGSRQTTESYSPGIFAGYNQNHIFADAMVSYTYNDYKIDRNIGIPNSASTATGEPTGNQYDAATLGGYLFPVTSHFKIGPAGGVGYTDAEIGGFNETGSPFDLAVSKQSVQSLRSLAGFQGQYTVLSTRYLRDNSSLTRPTLSISLNAYWQHEFLNSGRAVTSSINGLGSGSFVFQTGSPSRDSALMGLGVNGSIGHGVTLFANYESQIGDKKQFAQTVMLGAAISF